MSRMHTFEYKGYGVTLMSVDFAMPEEWGFIIRKGEKTVRPRAETDRFPFPEAAAAAARKWIDEHGQASSQL
jgi:hypothetical protein